MSTTSSKKNFKIGEAMPLKDPQKRREYQRAYMRGWYQRNKATHISYVRCRDEKIDAWFKEYKSSLSCLECGESHPACLEFHHLNPEEKKFSIGRKERRKSLKSLQDEIAKCRVLCANCHRKEHWKQRNKEKEKAESL
jgi:hypothetical protein